MNSAANVREKTFLGYSGRVWSWTLYDWANSAFILTVATAFFPGFFRNFWCVGADSSLSTIRLGYGNMVAGLLIAVMSPLFGAMAGVGHAKKRYLGAFMVLGVSATAALYWVAKGEWLSALLLFLGARIGFSMANLFYDSLLSDICDTRWVDMVSSLGFAVGYLGCGLFFVLNIVMFNQPALFGLNSAADAIRVTFVLTALWWLVFSIPLLRTQFERHPKAQRTGTVTRMFSGVREMIATGKAIATQKSLVLFLAAYWFYIDGVHTVYLMATDFGLSIGIPFGTLMGALLVVQFVAFLFALVFGWLAGRIGAQRAILLAVGIYVVVTLGGAWVLNTPRQFIFFAALTGLAQGGIQALSRSMFLAMIPPQRSAAYIGFYNMIGKFSLVVGPGIVASANLGGRLFGLEPVSAARLGISSLSVLFVIGGVLLVLSKRVPAPGAQGV